MSIEPLIVSLSAIEFFVRSQESWVRSQELEGRHKGKRWRW
ncbi:MULTISPECIES: hypothetical protein [unclassified Okeania]|nr:MULTISPECIES: hypothetical protein [unclassified Okeania]